METNAHYADYQGTVAGDRIGGTASNITGYDWTWDHAFQRVVNLIELQYG